MFRPVQRCTGLVLCTAKRKSGNPTGAALLAD